MLVRVEVRAPSSHIRTIAHYRSGCGWCFGMWSQLVGETRESRFGIDGDQRRSARDGAFIFSEILTPSPAPRDNFAHNTTAGFPICTCPDTPGFFFRAIIFSILENVDWDGN